MFRADQRDRLPADVETSVVRGGFDQMFMIFWQSPQRLIVVPINNSGVDK